MSKDKKAKIKEFKVAFLKPKTKDKETLKLTTKLEKAIKDAKGKKGQARDVAANAIDQAALRLKNQDADYYVEVLSYKLTKHWDDEHEFNMWSEKAQSPAMLARAVDNMMGGAPSDDFVKQCWDRFSYSRNVTDLCFEKAPQRLIGEAVEYIDKNRNSPYINSPAFQSKVALDLFNKGRRGDAIPGALLTSITTEDAREMAEADPDGFVETFLRTAQPTKKLSLLKDPEVRASLAKNNEVWEELKASAPLLGFFEAVQGRVSDLDYNENDEDDRDKATTGAVFAELMSDGGALPMMYYTNKYVSPTELLCSSPDETRAKIEKLKEDDEDDVRPDIPAAQCDELVTLLKDVIEGALGPNSNVKCKHIVLPGMVLTVPISTLPGGLLKNTFGGNVYDDARELTGQVLFTGNTDGDEPNAHTYLEVGGVNYDAVLGTKGDQVEAAVAEQFGPWEKTGWKTIATDDKPAAPVWVAKSKTSANWVIKEEGLQAAPNKNGFSTAYRLTTQIENYVTQEEGE